MCVCVCVCVCRGSDVSHIVEGIKIDEESISQKILC